jgi:hypothetical protein
MLVHGQISQAQALLLNERRRSVTLAAHYGSRAPNSIVMLMRRFS